MALAFCGLALGMQCALALGRYMVKRDPHWDLLRAIPRFPGRLGALVRKNVRETLSLLDPYAALLLSIGGGAYRLFGAHPDPAAFSIMALLVALAMSTGIDAAAINAALVTDSAGNVNEHRAAITLLDACRRILIDSDPNKRPQR